MKMVKGENKGTYNSLCFSKIQGTIMLWRGEKEFKFDEVKRRTKKGEGDGELFLWLIMSRFSIYSVSSEVFGFQSVTTIKSKNISMHTHVEQNPK